MFASIHFDFRRFVVKRACGFLEWRKENGPKECPSRQNSKLVDFEGEPEDATGANAPIARSCRGQ